MGVNFIKTNELVDIIISNPNKWVEARLVLNEFFCTTHFFIFSKGKLFDEGIDGEEIERYPSEFVDSFSNRYWKIDNIV